MKFLFDSIFASKNVVAQDEQFPLIFDAKLLTVSRFQWGRNFTLSKFSIDLCLKHALSSSAPMETEVHSGQCGEHGTVKWMRIKEKRFLLVFSSLAKCNCSDGQTLTRMKRSRGRIHQNTRFSKQRARLRWRIDAGNGWDEEWREGREGRRKWEG